MDTSAAEFCRISQTEPLNLATLSWRNDGPADESQPVTTCCCEMVAESQESSNMYFCFRWLLILFKREFSFPEIMRIWEVSRNDILWRPFLTLAIVSSVIFDFLKSFSFYFCLVKISCFTLFFYFIESYCIYFFLF